MAEAAEALAAAVADPLGPTGAWLSPSGEQTVTTPLNNEAHNEMLRAVDRGECVIFADGVTTGNRRVQHSAWLVAERGAIMSTWHRDGAGQWGEVQSCLVTAQGISALVQLLARGLRG